jgi:hypothetical protein
LQTPGPLTRALVTLGLATVPDGVTDHALLELLDDDRLPAWLREEAAGWLIFRNVRAAGVGVIADRLLGGQVRHAFAEKLQLLRQNAAPRPVRAPLRTADFSYVPLEARIASGWCRCRCACPATARAARGPSAGPRVSCRRKARDLAARAVFRRARLGHREPSVWTASIPATKSCA